MFCPTLVFNEGSHQAIEGFGCLLGMALADLTIEAMLFDGFLSHGEFVVEASPKCPLEVLHPPVRDFQSCATHIGCGTLASSIEIDLEGCPGLHRFVRERFPWDGVVEVHVLLNREVESRFTIDCCEVSASGVVVVTSYVVVLRCFKRCHGVMLGSKRVLSQVHG